MYVNGLFPTLMNGKLKTNNTCILQASLYNCSCPFDITDEI